MAALPEFTGVASKSVHLPSRGVGSQTEDFSCRCPWHSYVFGALRPKLGNVDHTRHHTGLLLQTLRGEHEVEPAREAPLLLLHPLVVVVHVPRGERIGTVHHRLLLSAQLKAPHWLRRHLERCTSPLGHGLGFRLHCFHSWSRLGELRTVQRLE